MPEDEQLKSADVTSVTVETDRSVDESGRLTSDELVSLTAKYRSLLAEKIDSDARAERAEKRVKELEELVKLKDAEFVAAGDLVKKTREEMEAVRIRAANRRTN